MKEIDRRMNEKLLALLAVRLHQAEEESKSMVADERLELLQDLKRDFQFITNDK